MKFSRFTVFLMVLLLMVSALSACGANNREAEDASEPSTAVQETTVDGCTVEQDADGNRITRDQSGSIVSVEDKNGAPLDVDEYVKKHPSENSLAPEMTEATLGDDVEGDIPVEIATMPDDTDNLAEFPDDLDDSD